MKIYALLPMKGHSERVPDKNIRLFSGKPLYHQIASVLQEIPVIEKIIINTDSEFIAADASKHFSKVLIHHRPLRIQGDFVSMNDIIAYDLEQLQDCSHFIQTHCTNPLLTQETLECAINEYCENKGDNDSLFAVTKLQTRLYWADGTPVNHDQQELVRTQDLDPLFEENSNFYLFSRESFIDSGKRRIGLNPRMFVVNKMEALDIDEEIDFQLAEYICRVRG